MNSNPITGMSALATELAVHPKNANPLPDFSSHGTIKGPCGDTMAIWLAFRGDRVAGASFVTDGCGSSRACASMATILAEGTTLGEVEAIRQEDILTALGGIPAEYQHCALLATDTLKKACKSYRQNRIVFKSAAPHAASSCSSCKNADCSAASRLKDETDEDYADRRQLQARLCRIERKIVVLSGKGGVGKSTVAVNLACALMLSGKKVGLLDVDIHGPSIPTMLNLSEARLQGNRDGFLPIEIGDLKVMSLGFLLRNQDDAVIWRGPMKMGVIKQFLKDVQWGDLDYLIIDSPPGTGDEPLSVCQLIGSLDGAVIVTTPQKVASVDVRKSVSFCRQLRVPVIGVVENMSGFVCPKCGEITQILPAGGGRAIAQDMNVPFLGAIPLDPSIAEAGDEGKAFIHHWMDTATAQIMNRIISNIASIDPGTPSQGS